MEAPFVTEEAALLALIREAPATRAVVYVNSGEDLTCCECLGGDPTKPVTIVAFVAFGSPAEALADRANEAACCDDLEAFFALPLRYGTIPDTWVLPQHPMAPRRPGETQH